jgi:hypothetical protein
MLTSFIAAFLFSWLLILSFIVYKTRQHYLNLISRTKKQRIDEILEKLVEDDHELSAQVETIRKELLGVMKDLKTRFKKVGLVRFNPFKRTGLDQSFVLALLNDEKSGIVINFIYTHEGVRVYAKKVKGGTGDGYTLSDEEREAIEKSN